MSALGRMRRSRPTVAGAAGLFVGVLTGLVVVAPLLRRGYVLSYDMVFVPRQPITATTLGLDGSVPRAVPTDLVVALLSRVVPADLLQKLILVSIFVLAGWGVARLVPRRVPAAAAALAYTWNAYVAERLVIGHWTMLLGYALLPWAVASAVTARRTGRLATIWLWLFVAALCGATVGVTLTATAVVVLAWPPGRRRAAAAAKTALFALVVNAPWWLPAVLRPDGIPADPRGITAFASHPDTSLGLLGSLLTLGGIWNEAAVPPERAVFALALVSLVAVAAVLVLGARRVAAAWDGAGAALLLVGLLALLVAAAASLPGLSWLLRMTVLHVPGGGLLRDAQKFLTPTALCIALCTAATVDRLVATGRLEAGVLAIALAVVPVVALPGLAWGVAGRLGVAHYPADWFAVRRLVAASSERGDVAVFPWRLYRRFAWNGDRVVLDPAQRFFDRIVVVNDDLPLTGKTVRGEDARAGRVRQALTSGENVSAVLEDLGVRFVVVEHGSGQPDGGDLFARERRVFSGRDLDLYELASTRPRRTEMPAIAGLGLAASAMAGLMAAVLAIRRRHSGNALLFVSDGAAARSVRHESSR